MTDTEKIQKMEEGETVYVNMSEDGGAQIHKYNYEYLLYEIPLYGGTPQFVGIYQDIDKMIETYQMWT